MMRLTRTSLVLLAVRFGATRLIDNMQVEIVESPVGAANQTVCTV